MLDFLGEIAAGIIARLIAYILFFPIWLAVATPLVLIAAPFHQGGIRGGYRAAIRAYDWCYLVA